MPRRAGALGANSHPEPAPAPLTKFHHPSSDSSLRCRLRVDLLQSVGNRFPHAGVLVFEQSNERPRGPLGRWPDPAQASGSCLPHGWILVRQRCGQHRGGFPGPTVDLPNGHGEWVFINRENVVPTVWNSFSIGTNVRFEIWFSMYGAIAQDVELS
jgi:hypothetical protein